MFLSYLHLFVCLQFVWVQPPGFVLASKYLFGHQAMFPAPDGSLAVFLSLGAN